MTFYSFSISHFANKELRIVCSCFSVMTPFESHVLLEKKRMFLWLGWTGVASGNHSPSFILTTISCLIVSKSQRTQPWFAKHRCLVTFGKSQDALAGQCCLLRRGWFSYISCLLSPTLCVCREYPRKSEISFMSMLSKPIQASKILIPCSASTVAFYSSTVP